MQEIIPNNTVEKGIEAIIPNVRHIIPDVKMHTEEGGHRFERKFGGEGTYSYNGSDFFGSVTVTQTILEEDSKLPNLEDYVFTIEGDQGGVVSFRAALHPQLVATGIGRIDPEKKLPYGIGTDLYKKIFPFIQEVVNARGIGVQHAVGKGSYIHEGEEIKPLEIEDWLKKFQPILEESGYIQDVGELVWRKIYLPASK